MCSTFRSRASSTALLIGDLSLSELKVYPNPFTSSTILEFSLEEPSRVSTLYNGPVRRTVADMPWKADYI